jgi:hypothetical protein
MVSDEEIVEWAKKHPIYSKYLSNLDALRILYQKQVLGETVATTAGRKYKLVAVKDLAVGQRVCIKGVVIEKQVRTYEGCEICRKKSCEHNAGRKEYTMTSLLVADATGSVWGHFMGAVEDVSDGDEVQIYGRVKKFGDNTEVNVDKVEKTMSAVDNREQVLKFIKKSGSLKKKIVEQMCNRFGVSWEQIADKVVVEGDTVRLKE